ERLDAPVARSAGVRIDKRDRTVGCPQVDANNVSATSLRIGRILTRRWGRDIHGCAPSRTLNSIFQRSSVLVLKQYSSNIPSSVTRLWKRTGNQASVSDTSESSVV